MHVRWTTDTADDLERICDYVQGTREITFPPLPFVAVYEVRDEQILSFAGNARTPAISAPTRIALEVGQSDAVVIAWRLD